MGIKGQNRHHTHYCSSMAFVEWVEMASPGWVCSRVTLCVDLIRVLTGNLFMLS